MDVTGVSACLREAGGARQLAEARAAAPEPRQGPERRVEGSLGAESAAEAVSRAQILLVIEGAVADLPERQREAFLLRYWEEFDVAETAAVMGCSEGSVKTHCSRAVQALSKALRSKGLSSS